MASSKELQDQIGLLACGSSGPWTIDIDEATSGAYRWFAQIDGPLVSLYFEVPSPDIVEETIRFLGTSPGSARLLLSADNTVPVTLVRDDEFSDRFFLVLGPQGNSIVHFSITGKHLEHLTAALLQVRDDLNGH